MFILDLLLSSSFLDVMETEQRMWSSQTLEHYEGWVKGNIIQFPAIGNNYQYE